MAQFVRNLVKAPVQVNAKIKQVPLTPAEITTAIQSLRGVIHCAQTRNFRHLVVKEAILNCLVTPEVLMWFDVEDITGKHGIIGYDV